MEEGKDTNKYIVNNVADDDLKDSDDKEEDEGSEEEHEAWGGKLDFVMSAMSMAVGMGNIWRFPYLCYRNGGGAFLIPYVVMVIVLGMPIMNLEFFMGQYSGKGVFEMWEICPLFKGCGIAQFLICLIGSIHYCMIVAYCFFYLFASFAKEVPWKSCDNWWNTDNCMTLEKRIIQNNCTSYNGTFWNSSCYYQKDLDDLEYDRIYNLSAQVKPVTATDEYFHNYMLCMSSGFEDLGTVQWQLILCCILSWVVVCACVCKGVKSAGKAAYFTALFPYVLLLILFISGLLMEGSTDGIIFYVWPDVSKLASFKVWGDAAVQVFFSLGLCAGAVETLSSYNNIHHDSVRDVFILVAGDSLTAIFAGFIIFSYLGAMAHRLGVPVSDVATQGAGLAFIVFPDAVTMLPVSQLWAVLFMLMCIMLGVGTLMANVEVLITVLEDMFPFFKKRKYNLMLVGVIFVVFVLSSIPFCMNGGMYVVQLMDSYSQTYSLLIVGLFLCVIISWIHGTPMFNREFERMYGRKPSPFWMIMTKFISPVIIVAILLLTLIEFKRSFYGDYTFPLGYDILGWMVVLIQMCAIPMFAIYQLVTQHTDLPLGKRFKALLQKTKKWDEHEHHEYEHELRKSREHMHHAHESVPLKGSTDKDLNENM